MGMMRGGCTGDGPMGGRGWRGQGRGQQVTPAP